MDANDFAGGLKSSRLAEIALPGRALAETQKASVWRPVHVVDLFWIIFDAQTPLPHRWLLKIEVDWSRGNFVIPCSPGKLFPIGAKARAAAGDFQIDNIRAPSLNQEYGVIKTHSSMDGRNNPF